MFDDEVKSTDEVVEPAGAEGVAAVEAEGEEKTEE